MVCVVYKRLITGDSAHTSGFALRAAGRRRVGRCSPATGNAGEHTPPPQTLLPMHSPAVGLMVRTWVQVGCAVAAMVCVLSTAALGPGTMGIFGGKEDAGQCPNTQDFSADHHAGISVVTARVIES